jgi:hypothetical protein
MRTLLIALIMMSLPLVCCGPADQPADYGQEEKYLVIRGKAVDELNPDVPVEPPPDLTYQTPGGLKIGVASLDLLRSADDPAPHQLGVGNLPREVDLLTGATFVKVDIGSIPEQSFSHMRVRLDYVVFEVSAVGHAMDYDLPGILQVSYALADYQDPELGPRLQGEYLATFTAQGLVHSEAGSWPVDSPPPYPGSSVDTSGGAYQVTFENPQHPIVGSQMFPEEVNVDLTFYIRDAFGWQDSPAAGHADGVFDISLDPSVCEQPRYMGIQGFSMQVY